MSEGVGHSLFEYLKGNEVRNSDLSVYLNKQGAGYADRFLVALIEIMCVDLGDEGYTYESLIQEFIIFKKNEVVSKAFKTCKENFLN